MGHKVLNDVWAHEPDDLSLATHSVLVTIADSASEHERMTCLGVDAIARMSKVSRRGVFRALKELYDRGILQNVTEEARPVEHQRYRSETRRVTEVEHWVIGKPVPDYEKPANRGDTVALESDETELGSDTVTPNPNNYLLSEGREILCSTSYYAAEPRSQGKPKRSWKSQPEDDDLDFRKYLDQDHDEDATTGTPRRTAPRSTRKRKTRPDSNLGLAWYFADAVSRVGEVYGLDVQSMQILASHIKRWRSQGDTPDKVRAMVDLFVADPGLRSNGTYAWKDFVARRAVIAARIDANALSGPSESPGSGEAPSAAPGRSQRRTATDDDYVNPFA